MELQNTPQRIEIDARRSLLDGDALAPEIAIKAHFAQQFGHIAIRHANDEILEADHDRFHELYIDKLMKHSLVIDRAAVARDFDIWVDAMLPAAHADIYEAMAESEVGSLPQFTSPKKMSEMATSADDELMHKNLSLSEENARLMNQLVGMSKERRNLLDRLSKAEDERDDLRLQLGLTHEEVLTDR